MFLQSPESQGLLMAFWPDEQENPPYLLNSPAFPTASAAEIAILYQHGWTASASGDEAPRSLDVNYPLSMTTITTLPVLVPSDLHYNLPLYQASPVRLPVIRVHIDVS